MANPELLAIPTGFLDRSDAHTRYGLINYDRADQSPAIARLSALVDAQLRAAGVDVPGR